MSSGVVRGIDLSGSNTLIASRIVKKGYLWNATELSTKEIVEENKFFNSNCHLNRFIRFLAKRKSHPIIDIEKEATDLSCSSITNGSVAVNIVCFKKKFTFLPEELLALHLQKIIRALNIGCFTDSIYLALPNFYLEQEVTSLINAAKIAGILNPRQMKNSDAICTYFRHKFTPDSRRNQVVLFLDVGYTYMSAFISDINKERANIVSIVSDPFAGLRNQDLMIFNQVWQQIQNVYGRQSKIALMEQCSDIKRLNLEGKMSVEIETEDGLSKKEICLDQEEIRCSIGNCHERTEEILEKAIELSEVNYSRINTVVICGEECPDLKLTPLIREKYLDKKVITLNAEAICEGCILKDYEYASFKVQPPCLKSSLVRMPSEGAGKIYLPLYPISFCNCGKCDYDNKWRTDYEDRESTQKEEQDEFINADGRVISYMEKMQEYMSMSLSPGEISNLTEIHESIVRTEMEWKKSMRMVNKLNSTVNQIKDETENKEKWLNEMISRGDTSNIDKSMSYVKFYKLDEENQLCSADEQKMSIFNHRLTSLLTPLLDDIETSLFKDPVELIDYSTSNFQQLCDQWKSRYPTFIKEIESLTKLENISCFIASRRTKIDELKSSLLNASNILHSKSDLCTSNTPYTVKDILKGIEDRTLLSNSKFTFDKNIDEKSIRGQFDGQKSAEQDVRNLIENRHYSQLKASVQCVLSDSKEMIMNYKHCIGSYNPIQAKSISEYYRDNIGPIYYLKSGLQDYESRMKACAGAMKKAEKCMRLERTFKKYLGEYEKRLENVDNEMSKIISNIDVQNPESILSILNHVGLNELLQSKSSLEFDKAFLETRMEKLNSKKTLTEVKKELDELSQDSELFESLLQNFEDCSNTSIH